MKANNTPRSIRLQRRIDKLQTKLDQLQPIKYGGSNPYTYCPSCNKSTIQITIDGHHPGCKVTGLKNEIHYYQTQLTVN